MEEGGVEVGKEVEGGGVEGGGGGWKLEEGRWGRGVGGDGWVEMGGGRREARRGGGGGGAEGRRIAGEEWRVEGWRSKGGVEVWKSGGVEGRFEFGSVFPNTHGSVRDGNGSIRYC